MKQFKRSLGFFVGFLLGQLYYKFFLQEIAVIKNTLFVFSLFLSVLLGIIVAASIQARCISALLLPMYCGKAGRGVLKVIVLTYVIAGPITNLGHNAKEVVRVFACSTHLSSNLSKIKYTLVYKPLRASILHLKPEFYDIKRSLRSVTDVIAPIQQEIEGTYYMSQMKRENNCILKIFNFNNTETNIEFSYDSNSTDQNYNQKYVNKIECRCQNHLVQAIKICLDIFSSTYDSCIVSLPRFGRFLCSSLELPEVCNLKRIVGSRLCDYKSKIDPGLGEGYKYLIKAQVALTEKLMEVRMQYKIQYETKLRNIQDAKETGDRVIHAFQEKMVIMQSVFTTIVNVFLALLFLRIPAAARSYHDLYLTSIDYDNVYVTEYFKRIDEKRRSKNKFSLLPLKKMERTRYIDVHSLSYIPLERHKLLTQVLKVMLEAVTATTFVMLDRLFFEALDVVRLHAIEETRSFGMQDLDIEVEGSGALASVIRKILYQINTSDYKKTVSNKICVPRPRAMPLIYYFKIYGGYFWILLLLYINPYTLRLRRLICSYYYPSREKQRILHLYNDILKKRMKIQKTLRRKAVQAVRAHYLSGENLLSLRIKFPHLLGWLNAFPVARMKCLICEETEPRKGHRKCLANWYSCVKTRCPFVYCAECWREVGYRCLACDPSLAELSDIDSLSDDYPARY